MIKHVFYLIPDIINEKRYLRAIYDRHFAELTSAQVYFFARDFTDYVFYILKKLSKTNKLIFMPAPVQDVLPIRTSAPTSIFDLARLLVMKSVFGHDITLGDIDERIFTKVPRMPDKFINEKVDRVISKEERNKMMKDFDLAQFKIFDVSKYSVIYFDNISITGNLAYNNILGRELTNIFNIVTKYFPGDTIARKYKPSRDTAKSKALVKVGDILEDFIPAELLYDKNVKVYLGITSGSLANVEKGLAVSLAYLVSFRDNRRRDELLRQMIQQSRSEILFPKSLDEFEKILADVKQQTT